MIKEQYKILCDLRDKTLINEDENFELLVGLAKCGYVHSTAHKPYNFLYDKACNYIITEKGKEACAEYEKSLRQENREIQSLQIAEEANKRASQANKISIWAIVISGVCSILSVVASVLIAIFVKT